MTEDPDQIRDGVEQTPDQIRDEIEQTQRELSADVDALTAKISPQRVVHDKFQRARTAMGSMKDQRHRERRAEVRRGRRDRRLGRVHRQ